MTTAAHPRPRRLPGHPAAYCGTGAAAMLPAVLAELGARRVLVVHGGASFGTSGAADAVAALDDVEVRRFGGIVPNPAVEQVAAATAAVRDAGPDAVVGIGGGSVLDVAKAAALLAAQDGDPRAYVTGTAVPSRPRGCRVVLLPTTSGSGSELTRFATVYVGDAKHSLDHPGLRGDVALVDPLLTASLPLRVAVAAALDALCHGVESYWSVAADATSRTHAAAALTEVAEALGLGLARGGLHDDDVRARLAVGAALAGGAIDLTRTTAAHALSYGLTARHGLPHGVAVALNLRWLVAHTAAVSAADCRDPRGPGAVRDAVREADCLVANASGLPIGELVGRALALGGHPTSLVALGLGAAERAAVAAGALASPRAANHPRAVTAADVEAAFAGEGS